MSEIQKEPEQQVQKLEYLVNSINFKIPPYQRPYKWTKKNVIQLLDDIFEYIKQGKDYRIGSIILYKEHEHDEYLEIVDGQQRLTTISLVLRCLNSKFTKLLLGQGFKHESSKNNIFYNNKIISDWLDAKFDSDQKKKNLKKIF